MTLTVTDIAGNSDSGTITVTVDDDVKPTVSVDIYGDLVKGKEIIFDASESTDNVGIASIEWEFGDGATAKGTNVTAKGTNVTAKGTNVTHTYVKAGNYTVNVTVTDEAGNTDEYRKTITIEKKDGDDGGGTLGFTVMILLFSLSLVAIYRYRKKKR